jgi:hypothetical protein
MPTFELVLKNEKLRFYNRFAVFVSILNGLAIIYFLTSAHLPIIQTISTYLVILLLVITFFIYFLSDNEKTKEAFLLFAAISIALCWIITSHWWLSGVVVLLLFLYLVSKRQLKVTVLAENIVYPSFPKRIIQWSELSNIILKDGLLTIDFKNNKIIQQLIETNIDIVNEKDFNEFCKQQMRK